MELSCTLCRQQTYLFYSAWNRIENNSNQNTRMPSIVDKNILIAYTWRWALSYSILTNERIGTSSMKFQIRTSYLAIRYDIRFFEFRSSLSEWNAYVWDRPYLQFRTKHACNRSAKAEKKTFDRSRRQKTFP